MLASTLYRCWHSMPVLCPPGGASRFIFPLELLQLGLLLAMLHDRARWVHVACAAAANWMICGHSPANAHWWTTANDPNLIPFMRAWIGANRR